MAGSLNRAQIIGHLGRDPEVRRLASGSPVVSITVATSEVWRDKNTGERRERTEWHNVVIFNEGLCRVAEQYLQKGSKVMIEGQLKTRKWQDQDGKDRYTTEIVLRPYNGNLLILDSRKDADERRVNQRRKAQDERSPPRQRNDAGGPPSGPPPDREPDGPPSYAEELDDQIPF